jgi:DNA-binding transcriptional ArsR family regulator
MSNDISPKKSVVLSGEDQIKAYVHPTRMWILKRLAQEKHTVSDLAKEIDIHPANLTHHIKKLEKAGLIRLVEKRDIGRNIEKYYRAVAYGFTVRYGSKSLLNKKALALGVLRDDLSATINGLRQGDARKVLALLQTVRLAPADVERFSDKLQSLAEEFGKSHLEKGVGYTLNLSLYPSEPGYPDAQERIIIE